MQIDFFHTETHEISLPTQSVLQFYASVVTCQIRSASRPPNMAPHVERNVPEAETQTCLFFCPEQNAWKIKPNTATAVETFIVLELHTTETTVHID